MQPVPMPAFEDEASLFSLAGEYLEAAEILARTPPIKINVSLVTFYLLGHAAELLLKSLLHKHGVPLTDLKDWKKYGHDLSKLIKKAKISKLYIALHSFVNQAHRSITIPFLIRID